MSKNIVVLSGSPRKLENTDTIVAEFEKSAKAAGKEVTVFRVADMKIGGCLGCRYCFKDREKGECAQKDDMSIIYDALKKADAIVFAAPIYFFSVTAQLKLAIDRIYALSQVSLPIKRTAMLINCGSKDIGVSDGAISMYNWICKAYDWENAGISIIPGMSHRTISDASEDIEKARLLAQEI